jgi:hypothetical protein
LLLPRAIRRSFAAFVFTLLLVPLDARAQSDTTAVLTELEDVELTLGGTLQPRVSYGRLAISDEGADATGTDDLHRFGFGLRRARLRFGARVGRVGASFQLGAAGESAVLLDALLYYDAPGALQLKLGRFPPAQPRSFQGTSHSKIDLVARSAVAQRWGAGTLANGGRDFGFEVAYETKRFTGCAGLYNGDGNWDRALGNVRPDLADGDPTGGNDTRGMSVAAYGAFHAPAGAGGLEVGGYVGRNAARNFATVPAVDDDLRREGRKTLSRPYTSYSAHVYWGAAPGSQPVRFKADFIGVRYEAASYVEDRDFRPPGSYDFDGRRTQGLSLLGALGVLDQAGEVLARYERYDPFVTGGGDAMSFLYGGVSFSPSALRGYSYARQRLTVSYGRRLDGADRVEDDFAEHLVVLQAQVLF